MMKNLIKPTSLLLYLLTFIVFFIGGFIFASLTGAAKGQGLAGGAIVLFYGVISAFFAFIISLFIAYAVNYKTVAVINKILGIICLVIVSYSVYKFVTREKVKEVPVKEFKSPKTTAPAVILFKTISNDSDALPQQKIETKMGMGFFKPDFYNNPALYFYGNVNHEKPVNDHSPYDSITFRRNAYNQFEIATAPPWLVPDHMKMDYDILYFKIQSVSRDFVEIVVNTQTDQTGFVDRYAGKISFWPEFLLSVNSIEFITGKGQAVRVSPLDYAGEEITPFEFMRPVVIKSDWMKVELLDDNYKIVGMGWIRWRDNEQLLVTYSLLS